ncbi:MAG TPA: hypothetical protein VIV15_03170 [Anaerolineales bacterium]
MKKETAHPNDQIHSGITSPESGREGWKEIAKIASIRNLQERTSMAKLLHSSKDFADVFLPNTHSEDRMEITSFPTLLLMIGAENGRERRRERGGCRL